MLLVSMVFLHQPHSSLLEVSSAVSVNAYDDGIQSFGRWLGFFDS